MLPSLIISSDSTRTTQTVEGMQGTLDKPLNVSYTRNLYHSGMGQIIEEIVALDNPPDRIMVLGHNPGFEMAASLLSGIDITMTTANVVVLRHTSDSWEEAIHSEYQWDLIEHILPKELP